MNSYSKVIRTFISSIVGFALISSPSVALNDNFHQGDPGNVQNNMTPASLLDHLHSIHHAFEDINNMMYFGNQGGANAIFSSLNDVREPLNIIDDQFLEKCFSEDNDDSLLENIENIIQGLRCSEENVYNLCGYFYNYDQNVYDTLYQIYCKLCYIDNWIFDYITNEINNIPNGLMPNFELMPDLSEEGFYNR